jgi:hypothetical protein
MPNVSKKKINSNDVPAGNPARSPDVPQSAESVPAEPTTTEQESAATGAESMNPNPDLSTQPAVPQGDPNQTDTSDSAEDASDGKGTTSSSAKPISEGKITTYRVNIGKSTGPTTPEGKAISARNSCTHGIFARHLIRDGEHAEEDRAIFEAILNSVAAHYPPTDGFDELLVEKAAVEMFRFSRVLSFEQDVLARQYAFYEKGVDRIARYQTTVNRQLFQAIDLLERLKAAREGKNGSGSKGGKK